MNARNITARTITAFTAVATAICASGCAVLAQDEHAPADLYYGFTLIDPDAERLVENAFIVVSEGEIETVGSGEAPARDYAARFDMTGRYAMAGFIDAHGHITAGPHQISMTDDGPLVTIDAVDEVTRFHARAALAFGVTTVRNPGADPEASAAYDAHIAAGEWEGPDAVHAGAVIQPPPLGGTGFVYPQTEEGWFTEAQRQADLGMTYFKLYTGLTEEELALGVAAAHAAGLTPIAHLEAVSWTRAAELGVEQLLHALPLSPDLLEPEARETFLAERGADTRYYYRWFELVDFDGPLFQDMLETLAANDVVVDLTLLVNELTFVRAAREEMFGPEFSVYFHPDSLDASRAFLAAASTGWEAEDFTRAEAAMQRVYEFARRLDEAGVRLALGTDGAGGGPIYAREMRLHVDAGFSSWRVLRLATSETAASLGLDEHTGALRAGLEADIVFLRENPVEDVMNARTVEMVVTNGRAFTFEELSDPGAFDAGAPAGETG